MRRHCFLAKMLNTLACCVIVAGVLGWADAHAADSAAPPVAEKGEQRAPAAPLASRPYPSVQEAAEAIRPAVVCVERELSLLDNERRTRAWFRGHGSGAIISPDGLILTARHVVIAGRDDVTDLVEELRGTVNGHGEREASAVIEAFRDAQKARGVGYYGAVRGIDGIVPDGTTCTAVGASIGSSLSVVVNKGRRDEQEFPVEPVYVDESHDFALLRLRTSPGKPLPFAALGDCGDITRDCPVAVVGFPTGQDWRVSTGTAYKGIKMEVSQDRKLTLTVASGDITQLALRADVREGQSGGPVINARGEILAVAAWKLGEVGEQDKARMTSAVAVNIVVKRLRERVPAVIPGTIDPSAAR